LDDQFALLTRRDRTALPRQRTLRESVDWSYDLLSEPERMLLRRLAIFRGGWSLEAAEHVCADGGRTQPAAGGDHDLERSAGACPPSTAILDLLASLVQK